MPNNVFRRPVASHQDATLDDMSKHPTTSRRIADEETTAAYMNTTVRHLRAMRTRREIPFVRLGSKLVRFDLDEIDDWLDQHRVGTR